MIQGTDLKGVCGKLFGIYLDSPTKIKFNTGLNILVRLLLFLSKSLKLLQTGQLGSDYHLQQSQRRKARAAGLQFVLFPWQEYLLRASVLFAWTQVQ